MKRIAVATLMASTLTAAYAEPMYISDKLVVNVYAEADQESSKVTTLDSGDEVEAIEKSELYTHVRLGDDREGWIKSSYLTAQVPAIVRLKELEKERGANPAAATTQLSDELKQAKERNSALEAELAAAKQAVSAPVQAVNATAPQKQVAVEQSPLRDPVPAKLTQPLGWFAAVGLLCGTIGFVLGYQALARRIRRKYGSVRIY